MATETQETTMVTERQAAERERAAFAAGACEVFEVFEINAESARTQRWGGATQLAAAKYPLPKVTRPRVLDDPHTIGMAWSVRTDGNLGFCAPDDATDPWRPFPAANRSGEIIVTAERVAVWADLLANPTEEVTP